MVKWIFKRKKQSTPEVEIVSERSPDKIEPAPKTAPEPRKSSSAPAEKRAARPTRRSPQPDNKPTETKAEEKHSEWKLEQFAVEACEGKTRFHDIDLPIELMHAISDLGFKYCTPVQAVTLPHILAGKDLAGQAQTGTGKTAAFLLGIFTHMLRKPTQGKPHNGTPRALVVAPTRELVVQLIRDAEGLAKHTDFKTMAVYGGLDYAKQEQQLRNERVDLIAATPGRLIDYLRKKIVDLSKVEILVLDEADRMLDMGFIPDVRRIVNATPKKDKRQTLLYSATLDEPVTRLSASWMNDPVRIDIDPEQVAADSVDQKVYIVTDDKKYALLYNIIKQENPERAIIFANRRDSVDRLSRQLKAHGFKCNQLSGAVSQNRRMRTLDDFRAGKFNLMIATDVAGRGLHIEGVSHIINFNVPEDPEDYIHRIGRTGRAGSLGTSITFACEKESFYLPSIEKLLGNELEYTQPEEEWLAPPPHAPPARRSKPFDNKHSKSRPPRKRSGGGRRRR